MKKFLPFAFLLLAGCETTISKEELASVNYGPRPERWQEDIRARQWGWAACLWVFENHPRGYPDTYPMTFIFRDGKIVNVNGGPDDANIVGGQYAREQCERLGAPFKPG